MEWKEETVLQSVTTATKVVDNQKLYWKGMLLICKIIIIICLILVNIVFNHEYCSMMYIIHGKMITVWYKKLYKIIEL